MQVNVKMSSVAGAAWKAVKPHIPMIKFRKGGISELAHGAPQPATAGAVANPTAPKPSAAAAAAPVLEEWQTPLKYRRRPITQDEIDYINRGGPA
ncbi:alpha-ketoglutarate dehydrogenase component 4-like [Palaemon carinicauda]|uniref:alpha-ketoglutarate dehydrogenase component 4-like n=1 Tax=Palaemon carinicauda TaxID=392227 RepID=UPI0035B610DF